MVFIKKNLSGIVVCLCISVPAWFLGKLVPVVGGPVFAIITGMILTLFIKDKSSIQSGITFTSKKCCNTLLYCWGSVLILPRY